MAAFDITVKEPFHCNDVGFSASHAAQPGTDSVSRLLIFLLPLSCSSASVMVALSDSVVEPTSMVAPLSRACGVQAGGRQRIASTFPETRPGPLA